MEEARALRSIHKHQRDHRIALVPRKQMRRGSATSPLTSLHHFWCVKQWIRSRGGRVPLWMFLRKQLGRRLAKLADLRLNRGKVFGVGDGVKINRALVGEGVEDVEGIDGGRAALLGAKDEIDPLVQMPRDVVTLKCLPALPANV